MPPIQHRPGTKSASTPSAYTDAQHAALERVKQRTPALKKGAARPEFVNHVMLVDGTIADDLAPVRAAAEQASADDRAAFAAFKAAHRDEILDGSLSAADQVAYINLRTMARHELVEEFDDHVAQRRFLFIVDADLIPRIYFQCAVEGNPDVHLADEADAVANGAPAAPGGE